MLLKSSVTFATTVYAVAAMLAAVACLILPIETTGKELSDTVEQQAQQTQTQNRTN